MAIKRKGIPKKTRFEVLKRDQFKCQYCGRSATEVILHIDHIKPVSKGGDNNILNLVTSCAACNLGKSDRVLSDSSVLTKQQKQLEEAQERVNQLQMMNEWRESLYNLEDMAVDMVEKHMTRLFGATLTDTGRTYVNHIIKKGNNPESLNEIMDDVFTRKGPDVENIVSEIQKHLKYKDKPQHEKDISYIIGILRNRFGYFAVKKGGLLLTEFVSKELRIGRYQLGLSKEYLLYLSKEARNWTVFRTAMEDLIQDGDVYDYERLSNIG